LYPDNVLIENTLRVWAISRWRGATELTKVFLGCGYGHLPSSPPGAPLRFRVEEVRGHRGVGVRVVLAHFTNPFDAFHLLGQAFWCGCEFIAFTTYNRFTNLDCIFPTSYRMHTLSYFVHEGQAAASRRRPARVKGPDVKKVARVMMV
jgi:hypothetical protein